MNVTFGLPKTVTKSTGPKWTKCGMLLLNEDPAIGHKLSWHLAEAGYSVLRPENGGRALGFVGAAEADVVLLDFNPPIGDAWKTFSQLAKANALVPVLLITRRADHFFRALASGFYAVLLEEKVAFSRLLDAIRSILNASISMRLVDVATAIRAVSPCFLQSAKPQGGIELGINTCSTA